MAGLPQRIINRGSHARANMHFATGRSVLVQQRLENIIVVVLGTAATSDVGCPTEVQIQRVNLILVAVTPELLSTDVASREVSPKAEHVLDEEADPVQQLDRVLRVATDIQDLRLVRRAGGPWESTDYIDAWRFLRPGLLIVHAMLQEVSDLIWPYPLQCALPPHAHRRNPPFLG